MKPLKRLSIALLILSAVVATPSWADVAQMADTLITAVHQGQPIPLVSLAAPTMDVDTAYAIQKAYVKKRLTHEKIAGFKAGLTSTAGQRRFGVNAPLAGVLFESGRLTGSPVIDKATFGRLMLETEIGFVIGTRISRPIGDVDSLRRHIKAIMPVIELPDLGFADMKQLKGVDIIAADVAARQFIVGDDRPVDSAQLNAVTVTLSLDGQTINTGRGSDAMGDQWQAALWLVNTMVAEGWAAEPGHVIITGALGKMIPGKPGAYVADYGDFGGITFEIR